MQLQLDHTEQQQLAASKHNGQNCTNDNKCRPTETGQHERKESGQQLWTATLDRPNSSHELEQITMKQRTKLWYHCKVCNSSPFGSAIPLPGSSPIRAPNETTSVYQPSPSQYPQRVTKRRGERRMNTQRLKVSVLLLGCVQKR